MDKHNTFVEKFRKSFNKGTQNDERVVGVISLRFHKILYN